MLHRGSIRIRGNHIKRNLLDISKGMECYENNGNIILMDEIYYHRIKSDLFSMYIMEFADDNEVIIELVTGGGAGDSGATWGAEKAENIKKVNRLSELAKEHSWDILGISPKSFNEEVQKYNEKTIWNSVKKIFR